MIDHINETQARHIVTIEDPIEVLHPDKQSIVNQREIGTDTDDFHAALKRVLRQDPDVIFIGEMRDPETVWAALVRRRDRPPRVLDAAHDRARPRRSTASSTSSRRTSSSRCGMSLAGVAARASSSQRLRRAGRRRRPGPGGRGARRRPAASSTRSSNPTRRTRSRRSSPTASTTACRPSTRACCDLYEQGLVDLRDALARVDQPARPPADDRAATTCSRAPAGLERRAAPPDRAIGSGRPARPRVTMAAMTAVPPRLAPLLAPGLAGAAARGALADAGHECYLVGGSVRDAFARPRRATTPTSTSPPTPGPTRSRRCSRPLGRRASWLQGERFGTVGADEDGVAVRDHHVPRRGVPPREPQARGVVRRRHRDRPVAARLHRQRDGAARSPEPELVDPFDGAADLAAAPAAHAARARGLVHRRPAAHAARGALHRRLRPRARCPSCVDAVGEHARPARDRERRAHPRRARRSCSWSTTRRAGPVVPRRAPGSPTSSCPSSTRCSSSRTRSTATRTCSRTRSRSSRKTRPELRAAAGRAAPRRRQAEDPLVRPTAA